MQYVICYDIADDRRRNRVATALLDFGQRVQESVFVAHLDEELAARMKERVERSGGKFHLASVPGKGVRIEVRVPRKTGNRD